MFEAGGPAKVRAAVLEKYASKTTFARLAPRTQVVVIATGALPVATPPETREKFTAPGVAEIVNVSPSVAVNTTLAVLEFSAWENAAEAGINKVAHAQMQSRILFLLLNIGILRITALFGVIGYASMAKACWHSLRRGN
ncbi:hypothetical protein [Edaphobacter flagellatus]|uniref:hypothetical protein n=1 Tax=Edaphobacter flagellatus TaxID=1933044 RepID=UPI0021B374AC|nr:hypothetical protein [Edaphobacter flagellatus]